jgi:predicted TIM-barrel enzyme
VSDIKQAATSSFDRVILYPWIKHFPDARGLWTSVLTGHDANASLLAAMPSSRQRLGQVYAAVFAIDPLRAPDLIIHRIKQAGIRGVINLPSVSFFDGNTAATLSHLSLGVEREVEFLTTCARQGLNIAGVVRSAEIARRLVEVGADFLLAHGGPPCGKQTDPSVAANSRIIESLRNTRIRCLPISSLHYSET